MSRTEKLIQQLQEELQGQKLVKSGQAEQFQKIDNLLAELRLEEVNPNFAGTIQEIGAYVEAGLADEDMQKYVEHHFLNISRWLEELSMLEDGGGAVTIDYEQRKGREI